MVEAEARAYDDPPQVDGQLSVRGGGDGGLPGACAGAAVRAQPRTVDLVHVGQEFGEPELADDLGELLLEEIHALGGWGEEAGGDAEAEALHKRARSALLHLIDGSLEGDLSPSLAGVDLAARGFNDVRDL